MKKTVAECLDFGGREMNLRGSCDGGDDEDDEAGGMVVEEKQ